MAISLELIKKLRAKTGAGIGDCKKALQEAGDFEQAEKYLKKQGLASASKRSERATAEGKIFTAVDEHRLVMVELRCETDFVAMTEQFQQLGDQLANQALQQNLQSATAAMQETVLQESAVLKENLVLGKITAMTWGSNDVVSCYSHNNGKIAVAVMLNCANADHCKDPEVERLCHDLALHAAAMAPQFCRREEVPEKFINEQQEIFESLADKENVNEKVRPHYVKGKLNKLLADLCFSEQNFVKSDKAKIKDVVAALAKSKGAAIQLAKFVYLKVGQE